VDFFVIQSGHESGSTAASQYTVLRGGILAGSRIVDFWFEMVPSARESATVREFRPGDARS
jgi:hypothetical protein